MTAKASHGVKTDLIFCAAICHMAFVSSPIDFTQPMMPFGFIAIYAQIKKNCHPTIYFALVFSCLQNKKEMKFLKAFISVTRW